MVHRQPITDHQPLAKFRWIVTLDEDPAKESFTLKMDEFRGKFGDEIQTLNFTRKREKLGPPTISPEYSAKFHGTINARGTINKQFRCYILF